MQTIPLYQTTGISDFKIRRIRTVARSGKTVEIEGQDECLKTMKREERLLNRGCGGRRQLIITIERRDAVCPDCGDMFYKHLPFLTNPRARMTRALEKEVVAMRRKMSITDVAETYGLSRKTVRDAEMRVLELKYARVPLDNVRRIGIDEIYAFPSEHGGLQHITIVRDLDDGRILNVSRGKGEAALAMFASRLKRLEKRLGHPVEIECVTMDMSNAYKNFVEHSLHGATIVFDHFHVIKMINDKINKIRRAAMAIKDRLQKQKDLTLKAKAQSVKEEELKLAREKFEYDAAKKAMEFAAEIKGIAADDELDDDEKIAKVREALFG